MRPQLALRVGITGHRWREPHHAPHERLGHDAAPAVRDGLRTVLTRIRQAVHAHQRHHAGLYHDAPAALALISALAEGADELAASVAVEAEVGYLLDIVAPYDLAEHAPRCAPGTPLRALWDGARSRLVLDGVPLADVPVEGRPGVRDEATLVETNRRLVWNSDIIIAIWDGLDARGVAGTARVVERARLEGLPVLHLLSTEPFTLMMLDVHGGDALPADPLLALDQVIERLLAVHPVAAHTAAAVASDAHGHSATPVAAQQRRALDDFAKESPPNWFIRTISSQLYGLALWIFTCFDAGARPKGMAASPRELQHDGDAPHLRLQEAFRHADYYATAYGARHRSTFTVILFGAPFAVLCAWAGSVVEHDAKLWWAVSELLLLCVLLVFYANSRRGRFHERWLDYRLLAERLRHLTFLRPLGRNSPVIRVPMHGTEADPRLAWANWWYRALTREIGLANVSLTLPVRTRVASTLAGNCIAVQAEYNRVTQRVAHRAEHKLHVLPWLLLLLALAAAATHVVEHVLGGHPPEWFTRTLTVIGILGPAFIAAFHGFANQAGLPEVGIRTAATVQQLERFGERLRAVDLSRALASAQLGDIALNVADVMGGDLAGWRVDYLARPVNPPG